MLALRLPKDIERRLDRLAALTGRSKSDHARQAIVVHLDELEAIYMAEKISEDIRAGREQTISLDEVMAELGMES